MGGRRSREKGKRWERAVATAYRDALGKGTRTGWHQSHGLDVADVTVPVPVPGYPAGIWNECKHHKRTAMRAAMEQALDAVQPGQLPVAVCKDDRKDALVVLRFADWLALLAGFTDTAAESGEETDR